MNLNSFSTVFEARERKFQTEKIFQGEDVDLVAAITNDGVPQDLTGYTVTGYYQPTDYPGTDNASLFYSVNAEISQDKKEVIVHWTYDKDFGKTGYMVWALLSKDSEHSYPVAWKINLAHSPGYPAGETPEPIPQVLDFSQYELLNAPWLPLAGGTVTGDVQVQANLTANKLKSADIQVNDAGVAQVFIGSGAGELAGNTNHGGVAIGLNAKTAGNASVAIGMQAEAQGSVAIGVRANARGAGGIAIGTAALTNKREGAEGSNSICIGNDAFARSKDSIAIGTYARVMENCNNAIQIGGFSDFSCNNSVPNSVQIYNQQVFQAVGTPSYDPAQWNLVLVKERAPWAAWKDETIDFLPTDWSGNPDITKLSLYEVAQRVNQCVAAIKGATIPKGNLPTNLPGRTHLTLMDGTEVLMDVTTIEEGSIDTYLKSEGYEEGSHLVRNIVVGSAVDIIDHHAFSGYWFPNLSAVDLSRTHATTLGSRAFYESPVNYVNLGSSIATIGVSAFSNCPQLKNLTIPSTVTSLPSYLADNTGQGQLTITWQGRTKAQVQALDNYSFHTPGTYKATDETWTV